MSDTLHSARLPAERVGAPAEAYDRPADALDQPAGEFLAGIPWEGPAPDPDTLDSASFLALL